MDNMPVTEKVLLYIENHLDNKLSLGKIAQELHYSKFYMARMLKEDMGCTLYKYIRGRQMDEAAVKLAETSKSIAEIALEAGYGSQQAFTQAFRCEYQCTPQEYRRREIHFPKGKGSGVEMKSAGGGMAA